jgi:hypothetical protein
VVADNQIGRIYLNVGDLYEQVSYVWGIDTICFVLKI